MSHAGDTWSSQVTAAGAPQSVTPALCQGRPSDWSQEEEMSLCNPHLHQNHALPWDFTFGERTTRPLSS